LKNDYAHISSNVTEIHSTEISETLAPWLYQLMLLAKRSWLNNMRLPDASVVKVSAVIATAVFIDILF
jgi:hypothetical protein